MKKHEKKSNPAKNEAGVRRRNVRERQKSEKVKFEL